MDPGGFQEGLAPSQEEGPSTGPARLGSSRLLRKPLPSPPSPPKRPPGGARAPRKSAATAEGAELAPRKLVRPTLILGQGWDRGSN